MEVATQVNRLTAQLQLVVTRLEGLAPSTPATPAPAQPSASPCPVRLAPPEKFSGESVREASQALLSLRQRNRRVVDYAIEFRTLVADSGWDNVAIRDAFVNRLTEEIKDHLAPMELPGNFESLVDMAT
ncbi:hypothetical protein L3Q82_025537 [Scortum barcoo]|uniref:Uncharacterized protein n=1 Tax=Scortum barcoo TaxID=214431 RepID=A0ACB8WKN2_9TELE|nr:hypothetical protein L3Q82_025537 [Scortum barcoo]